MNLGLRDALRGDEQPSRSLLLSLLTEACELEHGLACCYLFAVFSLKKELSEPGMTWERQRLNRMWAAQIFMVAAQEMQHLAEAWNLLLAFGGNAYYGRPPFPQTSKYYHLRHRDSPSLELTVFSRDSLDRFILFEEPDAVAAERQSPLGFDTIGGLYRRVEDLITELDHGSLFLGDRASQVGSGLADFPGLSPITDRDSAIAAVERIIAQGEGTRTDHIDSHLGVFRTMRDQLDEATRQHRRRLQSRSSRDLQPRNHAPCGTGTRRERHHQRQRRAARGTVRWHLHADVGVARRFLRAHHHR